MATNANFAAVLAERAQRCHWSPLPAFVADDTVWSHGQVHDLAARTARLLCERGVRPGGRVLLAVPDCVEWVVAFLAIARLGATAVLVNPELTVEDHAALLADSDPQLCLSPAELEDRFPASAWLDVENLVRQAGAVAPVAPAEVAADTPLYVQYTSGTTGVPKGVVHAHGDPVGYATGVGRDALLIRPDDVALSVSKMFWAYGFGNAVVFPLYHGASAVLTRHRPSAWETADLVAHHRVTVLYSVPSAYAALAETGARRSLRSVRAAVSAGEPMPEALGARLPEEVGLRPLEQIGSTEAGHAFCANTSESNTPGSLGLPISGWELEIRDEAGARVEPGQVGELWVRGPTLFSGYLNQPEVTARTLVDGWLRTHDRAVRGEGGVYRHAGRADDMELVGGISVSPLEIERVILSHPLVREAAVAAVRDDREATKLRAFVVPSATSPDLPAELIALARSRLPAFKVPRSVELVSGLPRTPTGKLRRHIVRTGSW